MLQRVDHLITKVREETDNKDNETISDYEIVGYINDGQRMIQSIIFESNPSADVFVKPYAIITENDKIEYKLPSDIYAQNSVVSLGYVSNQRILQNLRRVAFRERTVLYGYSTQRNNIILSSSPNLSLSRNLLMTYYHQVPLVGQRIGQISEVNGQEITIKSALIDDWDTRYEYISICDQKGNIHTEADSYGNQLPLELYVETVRGKKIIVEGDISNLEVGQYVVTGRNATTHSQLPIECENYLKAYIMRRMLKRTSSMELQAQEVFSTQEVQALASLFEDNIKDILYPVSQDTDYLDY